MKHSLSKTSLLVFRKGTSALEFALVMPVFMLLVMGILDFARYCYKAHVQGNAVREIARLASVNTSNPAFPDYQNNTPGLFKTEFTRLTGEANPRFLQVFRAEMRYQPAQLWFVGWGWKDTPRNEYIGVYADTTFTFFFGYSTYILSVGFTKSEGV